MEEDRKKVWIVMVSTADDNCDLWGTDQKERGFAGRLLFVASIEIQEKVLRIGFSGGKLKSQKEKIIDFMDNLLSSIFVGIIMNLLYVITLFSISLLVEISSGFLSLWVFGIIELLTVILRMSYIYWKPL